MFARKGKRLAKLFTDAKPIRIASSSSSSFAAGQRSWSVVRYDPQLCESIRLLENHSPPPIIHRPTDVLIRVLASSVNPLDCAMSRGYGSVALTAANIVSNIGIDRITYDRLPLTLGRDFVGEVVAKGAAVSRAQFPIGTRVWGCVPPHYDAGSHADYVVTDQGAIWRAPESVESEDAASIPYVGMTAWSALTTFAGTAIASNIDNIPANYYAGKHALILGAAGGVGSIAAQLLSMWGAKCTATCSADSMRWLADLSPACANIELIDYRQFADLLNSTTIESPKFDIILDASPPIAAANNYEIICAHYARRSNETRRRTRSTFADLPLYITLSSPLLRNLDRHGIIDGALRSVWDAATHTIDGFRNRLSVRWAYFVPSQSALRTLSSMIDSNSVATIRGKTFAFGDALDAYRWCDRETERAENQNGKAVIDHTK